MTALGLFVLMRSAAWLPLSRLRTASTTCAPLSASTAAVSNPRPEFAPVTIATRPDWSGTSAAVHFLLMGSTYSATTALRRRLVSFCVFPSYRTGWRHADRCRCGVSWTAAGRAAMAVRAGAGLHSAHEPVGDEPAGDAHGGDRSDADVGHRAHRAQVWPDLRNAHRHHRNADRHARRLPYGTRADWVRNVLDAGSATVRTQGVRVEVNSPTVVAISDVAGSIPRGTMRMLRWFGVSQCMHLEKS